MLPLQDKRHCRLDQVLGTDRVYIFFHSSNGVVFFSITTVTRSFPTWRAWNKKVRKEEGGGVRAQALNETRVANILFLRKNMNFILYINYICKTMVVYSSSPSDLYFRYRHVYTSKYTCLRYCVFLVRLFRYVHFDRISKLNYRFRVVRARVVFSLPRRPRVFKTYPSVLIRLLAKNRRISNSSAPMRNPNYAVALLYDENSANNTKNTTDILLREFRVFHYEIRVPLVRVCNIR